MGDCAGRGGAGPGPARDAESLGSHSADRWSPEALDRAAVRLWYGGGCAARLRAGGLGGRITVFGGCRGAGGVTATRTPKRRMGRQGKAAGDPLQASLVRSQGPSHRNSQTQKAQYLLSPWLSASRFPSRLHSLCLEPKLLLESHVLFEQTPCLSTVNKNGRGPVLAAGCSALCLRTKTTDQRPKLRVF